MNKILKDINIIDVENKKLLIGKNILLKKSSIEKITDNFRDFDNIVDNCEVYNMKNKYVIPGIINMHQHYLYKKTYGFLWEQLKLPIPVLTIRALKNAIAELKKGITTTRLMGSLYDIDISLKYLIEKEFILGPSLLISGRPLGITGSHANQIAENADSKDKFRELTRERVKYTDWVKVFSSYDPIEPIDETGEYARDEISVDELRVIVEEAHRAGKKVAAHAVGTKALSNVIEAGVDTIEHGIYLNDELAEKMKEKNIAIMPTLTAFTETCNPIYDRGEEWIRLHEKLIEPNQESFKVALKRNVKIGMGLDSLGDLLGEFKLMKDVGNLDSYEVLKISTINNAEILGLDTKIGSIKEGKLADLVILNSNPIENIDNITDINYVIKKGQLLKKEDINLSTKFENRNYNSNIKELINLR